MSMLKIVRTEHNQLPDKSEIRNYHVVANGVLSYETLLETMDKFIKKNKPSNGNINVLFYTTYRSAQIEDYKKLTGSQYIQYTKEHPVAYLCGQIVDYPFMGDLYSIIENNESYKEMKVNSILDLLYLDNIKNNKEKLRHHITYKNDINDNQD